VTSDPVEQLLRLRAETTGRLNGLMRERDGIVAGADLGATDDEHDPEGATLAFEREQISALIKQASERLVGLDTALARVDAGSYGRCASCGGAIAEGRLAARPDTTTCVDCAGAGRR
jgi:RNA polymerase-binding transcription factor DksA